jgi:hypothetical protein
MYLQELPWLMTVAMPEFFFAMSPVDTEDVE